jgi:hypothetical protein
MYVELKKQMVLLFLCMINIKNTTKYGSLFMLMMDSTLGKLWETKNNNGGFSNSCKNDKYISNLFCFDL